MNLFYTLKHMFPNLTQGEDYLLRDDGEGLYVHEWNNTEITQPTIEEINVYYEANKSEIDKPIPSQLDQIEQTQADLIFQLMINGVI